MIYHYSVAVKTPIVEDFYTLDPQLSWCQDQNIKDCGAVWSSDFGDAMFYFSSDTDAMAFKLYWIGDESYGT